MGGGGAPASVPRFQAVGTLVSGTGNISVPWPAHQERDIGLLCVRTANQAVATPAGGWAVAATGQGTGTAGTDVLAAGLQTFWLRAASNAEANAAVLDGGARQEGLIITFRNCVASGDPINVSAGDAAGASTAAVSIPGATTTAPNCLVVAIKAHPQAITQNAEANASLSDLAERFDGSSSGGIAIVTGLKSVAGIYPATTATQSGATVQARSSLALLPK